MGWVLELEKPPIGTGSLQNEISKHHGEVILKIPRTSCACFIIEHRPIYSHGLSLEHCYTRMEVLTS